jgi:N-acetyl-anhydromuramyl-L-alanine amidase AmpD
MVTLALTTGVTTGCPRRATLVPPDPVPQYPAYLPPKTVRPSPPPVTSDNPWKPGVAERKWTSIVIHHTASNRGSVESIHAAHLRRKDGSGRPWRGIGYHFVIGNGNGMPDGEVEATFRWRAQIHGAHAGNKEHNEHGIGIALIGNFEQNRPTAAQLAAVKRLVAVLKQSYGIASKDVLGHNSVKATACPGKFFPLAQVSEALPDEQFSDRRRFRVDWTPLVFLKDRPTW